MSTGAGLADAVDEVEAVFHCASSRKHLSKVDVAGTKRLLMERSGNPNLLLLGMVGAEVVPSRYFRDKLHAESVISRSQLGWSVLRTTVLFPALLDSLPSRLRWPIYRLPRSHLLTTNRQCRGQPHLDRSDGKGSSYMVEEIGGAQTWSGREIVRSYLTHSGKRRQVWSYQRPRIGGCGSSCRWLLCDHRTEDGLTREEFLRNH